MVLRFVEIWDKFEFCMVQSADDKLRTYVTSKQQKILTEVADGATPLVVLQLGDPDEVGQRLIGEEFRHRDDEAFRIQHGARVHCRYGVASQLLERAAETPTPFVTL